MQSFDYYGVQLPQLPEGDMALGAVVSIKVLASDGSLQYREFKSPSTHSIEALGMLETFSDSVRASLMHGSRRE